MEKWLMVADVVKMLQVPEGTIYRWIRQGDIPCIERRGEYIFNQSTIVSWAASKNILLKKKPLYEQNVEKYLNTESSSLVNAIQVGKIFYNIDCSSIEKLFKDIPKYMNLPKKIQNILPDLLKQREILSTTGIGNGIAIPHPKNLIGTEIPSSMISTFFLKNTLDFKVSDDIPVFVVFVILSKNSTHHLELLSQLTRFLNFSKTINFLKKSPSLRHLVEEIQKNIAETY